MKLKIVHHGYALFLDISYFSLHEQALACSSDHPRIARIDVSCSLLVRLTCSFLFATIRKTHAENPCAIHGIRIGQLAMTFRVVWNLELPCDYEHVIYDSFEVVSDNTVERITKS